MLKFSAYFGFFLALSACNSTNDSAGLFNQLVEKAPSNKQAPYIFRFDFMPLKKGQFAQYLIHKPDNTTYALRMEIVDKGDVPLSYWLETEFLDANNRKILRVMMVLDEARMAVGQKSDKFETVLQDYNRFVRARVWSSGDSSSQLVDAEMLPRVESRWGDPFVLKNDKTTSGSPQAVQVKAGKFKCHKAVATANFLGAQGTFKACVDSAVPLNGVVEATDSLNQRWELVSYGVTGSNTQVPDVFP